MPKTKNGYRKTMIFTDMLKKVDAKNVSSGIGGLLSRNRGAVIFFVLLGLVVLVFQEQIFSHTTKACKTVEEQVKTLDEGVDGLSVLARDLAPSLNTITNLNEKTYQTETMLDSMSGATHDGERREYMGNFSKSKLNKIMGDTTQKLGWVRRNEIGNNTDIQSIPLE